MGTDSQLIVAAAAGIALILFLIVRTKLHAFVALLLGSLVVGVLAGMPYADVLESMASGVGSTLASIAVVVGLGAMFGRMLEVSGGAESLAASLLARSGDRHAQWPLLLVGFIVAIPVFFDVAFVVLISVVYGMTEKSGRPIVYFAVPLLAGLVVAHAFVPPTPGPIAVAGLLDADLGLVMLFGLLIGIPSAIVAGPLFGRFIATRVKARRPDYRVYVTRMFARPYTQWE
jgi:Gnt-I system low-affinity gluconate transporter